MLQEYRGTGEHWEGGVGGKKLQLQQIAQIDVTLE